MCGKKEEEEKKFQQEVLESVRREKEKRAMRARGEESQEEKPGMKGREGESRTRGRERGGTKGAVLFTVYCFLLLGFCWWLGGVINREGWLEGGGIRGERGGGRRTEDKTYRVEVSLEDVFNEQILSFEGERIEVCDECHGMGVIHSNPPSCPACQGRGVQYRTVKLGPYQSFKTEERCSACHGTGTHPEYICPKCHGHRHIRKRVQHTVPIPAGLEHGQVVVLEGESDEYVDHESGDVRVVLLLKRHRYFDKDGDNLVTNMTVPLKEALLGFAKTIKHLDGSTVDVQSTDITGPGDELLVKGMGLPKEGGGRGDLRVRVRVDYQKNRIFSQQQKQELVVLLADGK